MEKCPDLTGLVFRIPITAATAAALGIKPRRRMEPR
jgi:hypothetical protein